MGRKRIFTDEDIEFILKNYEVLGYDKLGEILGHNAHSIRSIYSKEKIHAEQIENISIADDYEDVDPEIFVSLMIASIKNHRKYADQTAFIL